MSSGTPAPTGTPAATDLAASPSAEADGAGNPLANVCGAAIRDGVLQCPAMVALATARLGVLHAPIATTTYRRDLCPPNARCMFPPPNQGWVIFTFLVGDPVMVHVTPVLDASGAETPALMAEEPQPLPDWLLAEINEAAA